TFEMINEYYSKDKNAVYKNGKRIREIYFYNEYNYRDSPDNNDYYDNDYYDNDYYDNDFDKQGAFPNWDSDECSFDDYLEANGY
ncbi:hypothetical protein KGV55_03270, partial [Candidatus Gracilibacteria bacterium]|nr:hypothetical protein [Candidatus Gracilibacteria bacterium]